MFPFCACFFPPSFLDHLFPCLCSCSIQCEKVRDHFLILYFPPCVSILICVHWEAPIKLNWKKSGSKTRICLTKLSASLYQRLGHVQAPQMALLFCHETSGIWILCLCWHFFFFPAVDFHPLQLLQKCDRPGQNCKEILCSILRICKLMPFVNQQAQPLCTALQHYSQKVSMSLDFFTLSTSVHSFIFQPILFSTR